MEEEAAWDEVAKVPIKQTSEGEGRNDCTPLAPGCGEDGKDHENGDQMVGLAREEHARLDDVVVLDVDVDKRNGGDGGG